ncbi:beta-lactamase family protein [Cellulomonas hominis]|uniref:serine hydrolase domain-containing protein n=1 Tax=Cellulomonas hominis TaxID=156981 RepID=UPI001C10C31D|nr:serine hydrolase domain-containing protein [Cellulomonas hominis]MBU5423448.1 beta-lactamase family protein [Cellulomonas hominis]
MSEADGRTGRHRALVAAALAGVLAAGAGLLGARRPPTPSTDRTGDPALSARLAELAAGGAHDQLSAAVLTPAGTVFGGLGADEHTSVEIGSITKTLTSLLLAQSVASGTVRPEDPAAAHLDLGAQPFTLEQLASHRSGLPRLAPGVSATLGALRDQILLRDPYTRTLPELEAAARGARLSGRGDFRYSNLGAAVLGQAVAAAEGTGYRDLVHRRVLEPLGMTSSYVPVTRDGLRPGAPRGTTTSGRVADPWTLHAEAPAGGVRSTAADMARYARALLTSDPALGVPPATVLAPRWDAGEDRRVGLAWITQTIDGRTVTWHNGGTSGFRSMLALDVAAGTAVFVAGNTGADVDEMALALLAETPAP